MEEARTMYCKECGEIYFVVTNGNTVKYYDADRKESDICIKCGWSHADPHVEISEFAEGRAIIDGTSTAAWFDSIEEMEF